MHNVLFDSLFNEVTRYVGNNPFPLSEEQFLNLSNSKTHFLDDYNYMAGFRLCLRRNKWQPNEDKFSKEVITEKRTEGHFNYKLAFDDEKSDFTGPSGTVYSWRPDGGVWFVSGGYSELFSATMTYSEAIEKLERLKLDGWFDKRNVLYLGLELFVYNVNTY